MDLLAVTFGISLLVVSVIVTYLWGIKPDRETKKRQETRAFAEMRRLQSEQSQKRRTRLT